MRISILGANGQLGRDLTNALAGHSLQQLTRSDFDVADHARVRDVLRESRPEIVVNLTAYHRVDDCEDHPQDAFAVNALAVLNLARIANELDAALVHISTDYVFGGTRATPYAETDEPFPLSVYGNSKVAGEYLVRTQARKYFLIRTCGLYGHAGSRGRGGNFVEKVLVKAGTGQPVQVVSDQTLTPTSTADLARQMAVLLPTTNYGLFHITNEGECSWFEFTQEIFKLAGVNANLSPITSEYYKSPAIRPRYSVLENRRLNELGLNRMLQWREALAEYLSTRL